MSESFVRWFDSLSREQRRFYLHDQGRTVVLVAWFSFAAGVAVGGFVAWMVL